MRTSQRRYDAAQSAYKTEWGLVDEVLYGFCRRYPDHRLKAALNAKLRLIGRTYETGIERGMDPMGRKAGAEGKALNQLAEYLLEARNRSAFDGIVRRLEAIGRSTTLTQQALETIVVEHGRFVQLLKDAMQDGESPRSFASKYLHFHCPAVPIMDSNAAKESRKLCPWRSVDKAIPRPREADEQYYRFALRFWQVYRQLQAKVAHVSVRGVDRYLLAGQRQEGPRPRGRHGRVGRSEQPSRRQTRSV